MKNLINIIFTFLLVYSFTGCSTKKNTTMVHAVFQTNGASLIREYRDIYSIALEKYYKTLNARNPSFTSKKYSNQIFKDIRNYTNLAYLPLKKKNPTYIDYLKVAFSSKHIRNRNDYLIAGMYKMYYWAYEIDREHTLTALQYDTDKLQKLYKMLQVVEYKINTYKKQSGNYLFLTWQRKWQVDLLKNTNKGKEFDCSKYSNKELMYPSNMEFQIMMRAMQFSVKQSLKYLGDEAVSLSISAVKSLSMFI